MGAPDFGGAEAGVGGKIDFLFVVSSEGTMKGSQGRLLASYPGSMDAIEEQLPGLDIHVLSANTNGSLDLDDRGVCTDSCDPAGEPPFCGAEFKGCDKKVGASVVFPTGKYAANRRCKLDSGLRYTPTGQQDLAGTFSCIVQLGTEGAGVAGEAMAAAVQPAILDPVCQAELSAGPDGTAQQKLREAHRRLHLAEDGLDDLLTQPTAAAKASTSQPQAHRVRLSSWDLSELCSRRAGPVLLATCRHIAADMLRGVRRKRGASLRCLEPPRSLRP